MITHTVYTNISFIQNREGEGGWGCIWGDDCVGGGELPPYPLIHY